MSRSSSLRRFFLSSALAIRDGRLDAAEAALAVLQAAGFQSAADVAAALATALAGYTDTAGLNALLAVRDARLDGHDAEILALQGAGPFATAADLSGTRSAACCPSSGAWPPGAR